jgi:hypothetical protein
MYWKKGSRSFSGNILCSGARKLYIPGGRIYHEQLLVLAIEYKKIFMNEWTGELYQDILDKLIRDFNRAVDRAIETCMLHLR